MKIVFSVGFTILVTIFHQLLSGNYTRGVQPTYNRQSSDPAEAKKMSIPQKISNPQQEALPIDQNSTIASDIIKIWHEADSKETCVELKQDARCPHPALLGRLSGPGLAILEWKERSPIDGDTGTILCGRYDHNWLEAGDYFVEIIIVHCKDFGVNALQRTNNITAWLKADHTLDYVEDALHHRITVKGRRSIIHIPTSIEGRDIYRQGRWVRKQGVPSRPLFERYQPVECFDPAPKKGSPMYQQCVAITNRDENGTMVVDGKNINTSITGLYEYEFQWNMKQTEQALVEKLRQRLLHDKKMPNICGIGDSHTRYMLDQSLPELNLTGLFDYIPANWIYPEGIVEKITGQNCDVFFVQVGIWPASSNTGGHPFSFGKYHDKLKKHVQNILSYNPNATIYLPTIDQGPIMGRINKRRDWRTPTMLDGYSHVNQMIVQELNTSHVKYIDTNFIIYTHFDGHEDWQHLMEIVRSRKTIYMSAIMLGETGEWLE